MRGRPHGDGRRHHGAGALGSQGDPVARDRVPAEPGAAPGLHRRARRGRPGGDARRDAADGRRPQEDQPPPAGRAGHRPLGPGRRGGHDGSPSRPTPSWSSAATASATPSSAGARRLQELPRRAPRHRDRPPGQSRVPGPRRLPVERPERGPAGRPAAALPRHAGRDRLAHDDDQRPGRAGLGRRRDRGRGGDARPAGLDARAAGRRIQARRDLARGLDRDRPGPDRHRDAPPQGGGRQVRRVLRRGPGQPAAGRPGHDRQHGPRIRRHLRDLPGRRRDDPLPGAHGPPRRAHPARRGLLQGDGAVPHRRDARGPVQRHARARPLDRRAEPGRAQTAAGPGAAAPGQGVVPEGAEGHARREAEAAAQAGLGGGDRDDRPQERASGSRTKAAAGPPSASRTRPHRRPPTGRSGPATSRTARSSSRRSPVAPTRRTRR